MKEIVKNSKRRKKIKFDPRKCKMSDKERADLERKKSYLYMMKEYNPEERHLKIFARDFDAFLKSAEYLCTAGKHTQKCYDFLVTYESLLQKMDKYKWSRLFLFRHGIDIGAVEMLYRKIPKA